MTKNRKITKAELIEKEERQREKVQRNIAIEKLKETRAGGIFGGFFEFLQKYSVLGLAIGLVIGDSSKSLVNSIVSGFITPFIGLFLPNNKSLETLTWTFRSQTFKFGDIINQAINFVIILFIIYFTIKVLLRRDDVLEKK